MSNTLHITSGDCAGDSLAKSGISGEVFVWHDILYDRIRNPGWPNAEDLETRAKFLREALVHNLFHDFDKFDRFFMNLFFCRKDVDAK